MRVQLSFPRKYLLTALRVRTYRKIIKFEILQIDLRDVVMFVAPGPDVAIATPTLPLARA